MKTLTSMSRCANSFEYLLYTDGLWSKNSNKRHRDENKHRQNFNGSNTDGLFTAALSNSFLSPLEKNPIAADLGYFTVIFFFILKMAYFVFSLESPHRNGIFCVLIRIASMRRF